MKQIRKKEDEKDHFQALAGKHHAEEMVLSYNVHMMHEHLNQVHVFLYTRQSKTLTNNSVLKRNTSNVNWQR